MIAQSQRSTERRAVVWVLVVLCALNCPTLGCSDSDLRFPGEGPVGGYARRDRWMNVYMAKGANLGSVARLDLLGDFGPGEPPAFTGIVAGKPEEILTPDGGSECWVYENSHGKIWMCSEEAADGDRSYPLYFFPYDTRPTAFLLAAAMKHADVSSADERVMVYQCGFAQPSLQILLKFGRIDKVVWSSIDDLAQRASADDCGTDAR